jgi:transcription elongation factor SPT6
LGSRFIVEGRYEFSDLDELIVNHVQAMARRVEELMAHEKYKHGEDELRMYLLCLLAFFIANTHSDHWLRQYVKAHPNKSIYGFMLNRKRPGHFSLCFLANVSSAIQTWVGLIMYDVGSVLML